MLSGLSIDVLALFVFLAGFVIGQGAVIVIDWHGFLAKKSSYWTEATTRSHKVTKPLIWLGILLAIFGGVVFYRNESLSGIPFYHSILATILILNGLFLSFSVSPFLLEREKAGRSAELLPQKWQLKITLSFIISFIGWWSALFLLAYYLIMLK